MRVTKTKNGIGRLLACAFCGFLYFIGTAALSRADVLVDQVSNTHANPGSQLSWSHTVGSGNDRLLLVWVAAFDLGSTSSFPATIKYGNQSLKLIGTSGDGFGLALFQVPAPVTGTHTITVTMPTTTTPKAAGAISVTGVNPSAPPLGFIVPSCPNGYCGNVFLPNGAMAIGARLALSSCGNLAFAWNPTFGNFTNGNRYFDWGSFRAEYGLGQASAESTASIEGLCPNTQVAYLTILPKNFNGLSISGKIKKSDGSPVSEVRVEITSPNIPNSSGYAFTDTAGNYSFVNLPAHDTYTLALRSYYFTFDPPSPNPPDDLGGPTYPFVDLATNVTANFTAVPRPTYSLSGRVSRENTTPVSGVTVTAQVSGPVPEKRSVVTDAHGNYVITNLPCNYPFTVEPTYAGYTFSPPNSAAGSGGVCASNATSDFAATMITSSPTVQWTTQPNPKLPANMGRLVVNFLKEVEYRFSGVEIFPPGGTTATRKQSGTERDITLMPAQYDVAISGARVANLPITLGTDTRLLAGALRIQAGDKTRVEVWDAGGTRLLVWTIGRGGIGLPVGHFMIKVGKGTSAFTDVIIEDGKVTDFQAP